MTEIPDLSDNEVWTVRTTLQERFGRPVEPERADCDLRIDPESSDLVECPALFWQENDCNFVVFKIGDNRFRCQFFYRPNEMFGVGIKEFDNIGDCVLTLLRVQADHEAEREGNLEKQH